MQFYARTPKQILDERTAFVERQQDFNAWAPGVIFYNRVGKVLVSVGMIDLGDYSFRLHDLIARSRLLDLQRRLIRRRPAATERAIPRGCGSDEPLYGKTV